MSSWVRLGITASSVSLVAATSVLLACANQPTYTQQIEPLLSDHEESLTKYFDLISAQDELFPPGVARSTAATAPAFRDLIAAASELEEDLGTQLAAWSDVNPPSKAVEFHLKYLEYLQARRSATRQLVLVLDGLARGQPVVGDAATSIEEKNDRAVRLLAVAINLGKDVGVF